MKYWFLLWVRTWKFRFALLKVIDLPVWHLSSHSLGRLGTLLWFICIFTFCFQYVCVSQYICSSLFKVNFLPHHFFAIQSIFNWKKWICRKKNMELSYKLYSYLPICSNSGLAPPRSDKLRRRTFFLKIIHVFGRKQQNVTFLERLFKR